jgi:hypothetical protein
MTLKGLPEKGQEEDQWIYYPHENAGRMGNKETSGGGQMKFFNLGFISGIATALIAVWAAFEVMA